MISGELHVAIGFDEYLLEPGDAISIDSRIPHRLANLGDTPVHAIWFVLGRVSVEQGSPEEPTYTPSTERRTRPSARSSSDGPSRTMPPSDSR